VRFSNRPTTEVLDVHSDSHGRASSTLT
jgi:hypothetical protein